ncbi:MAG: hypothetical protein IJ458_01230 [Clostridia bacterium]|nr:hypothetical protein [Clostridia bacterium]
MAKDAKKVQTKAKINWGWDSPEDRNGKATRSTKSSRATSRKIKKLGFKAILIILLVTLIGGAIGVGACWFVCRDDCFTIIGQDELTIPMTTITYIEGQPVESNNKYYDEGVKVVSFGRDISKDVYIETDLKQNEDGSYYADEVGTYYIIYKVDDIKYGKIFTVERIRLITFVEGTPDNKVE